MNDLPAWVLNLVHALDKAEEILSGVRLASRWSPPAEEAP